MASDLNSRPGVAIRARQLKAWIKCVGLRQVFTGGPHLLPDEGHRIQSQHIDTRAGNEIHFVQHGSKHGGFL